MDALMYTLGLGLPVTSGEFLSSIGPSFQTKTVGRVAYRTLSGFELYFCDICYSIRGSLDMEAIVRDAESTLKRLDELKRKRILSKAIFRTRLEVEKAEEENKSKKVDKLVTFERDIEL